ncbi:hypothetical protein JCM1840_005088 [Sporobolomyces johnsonii]
MPAVGLIRYSPQAKPPVGIMLKCLGLLALFHCGANRGRRRERQRQQQPNVRVQHVTVQQQQQPPRYSRRTAPSPRRSRR